MELLRKAWARRGVVGKGTWLALLPSAALFSLGVRARNSLHRWRWLRTRRLPRPVVSVGNLTVGGTGKTPTTLWLARALSDRGHRVAILSRGYGGSTGGGETLILHAGSDSLGPEGTDGFLQCADEPLMMYSLYGQTVGIGARRYESGRKLCERDPALEAFVLDDGFQHRQLARDFDLVLLGADWSGSMLPAGPFREPIAALDRAHAILVTAAHEAWKSRLDARCETSNLFFGELKPCGLVTRVGSDWCEVPLAALSGVKVLGVSAIADPTSFYAMLQHWEAEIVDVLEFPDHHSYTTADWHEISRRGQAVDKIITTEKDLVKLVRYPFARGLLFALRVEMTVERQGALLDLIEARLFGDRVYRV